MRYKLRIESILLKIEQDGIICKVRTCGRRWNDHLVEHGNMWE
jgi:hypothetical protein